MYQIGRWVLFLFCFFFGGGGVAANLTCELAFITLCIFVCSIRKFLNKQEAVDTERGGGKAKHFSFTCLNKPCLSFLFVILLYT